MMKTEPIALCTISTLMSCESVSCRHICKGSYSPDDLDDNEVLITIKDGTSSIVDSAERFTTISIGSSATSVGREEISSYSDTNSATISSSGFSLSSPSGSGS